MKININRAKQLDDILKNCVRIQTEDASMIFDSDFISGVCQTDELETDSIIQTLINFKYGNEAIVFSIGEYMFKTYHNTIDFIESGGFVAIVTASIEEQQKRKLKESLEIKSLELGPKQYKFNKISVVVNLIFTLITILISILIATKVIS
mgnify:CR=1 FL=1